MSTCIWTGTETPRAIKDRHVEDCADETCRGCQPCEDAHCCVCGMRHVGLDQTCAQCVGAVRENLAEVGAMWVALPDQAVHDSRDSKPGGDRVLGGDAMVMLAGRWTDQHGEGRRSDPTVVLPMVGDWEHEWRREFGHDTDVPVTVESSLGYLDLTLTYAAQNTETFADFAREMRMLVTELENVLHDGDRAQVTKTPCIKDECSGLLMVEYGNQAKDDRYRCTRCKDTYDRQQYTNAQAEHLSSQDANAWVRIADAVHSIGRTDNTVRTWIKNGHVQTAREPLTGRLLVWWPDVRDQHKAAGKRDTLRKFGRSA